MRKWAETGIEPGMEPELLLRIHSFQTLLILIADYRFHSWNHHQDHHIKVQSKHFQGFPTVYTQSIQKLWPNSITVYFNGSCSAASLSQDSWAFGKEWIRDEKSESGSYFNVLCTKAEHIGRGWTKE